jgi:hypothetical protein
VDDEGEKMKALSVRQPAAGMIMDGVKDIEIRSWGPANYSLPYRIAIVSAKNILKIELNYPRVEHPIASFVYDSPRLMKRGFVLGHVLLTYIKTYSEIEEWRKDAKRHRCPESCFFPGVKGWVLEDPWKIRNPVACKGALSLFYVPDSTFD